MKFHFVHLEFTPARIELKADLALVPSFVDVIDVDKVAVADQELLQVECHRAKGALVQPAF